MMAMPTDPITEKKEAPPPVDTIPVKVNGVAVAVPKTTPDPLTGKPMPTTMIQACAWPESMCRIIAIIRSCRSPVIAACVWWSSARPAWAAIASRSSNPTVLPKIAKSPRPAIACATPVSPHMEIYTNTPGVKQMRQGVLEFLLINHPLDCPICDQAGECKLQEYSVDYGQSKSRFVEEKVHKPKRVDLGPRIVLDDERCILCTRCIRFTRDFVGDDALGIVNRGSYSVLTTYPGKSFDNNYTLNTVDICPVGALTSKDFRFKMRVWFLKETKSLCTSCATGCNIIIGSRENRVYRYEPRENDAVNACWMCDYGRLNYKWINHPDRLSHVQARRGKGHPEVIAWSRALKEIADHLNQAAPGSVSMIVSARQTNEELYLLSKLARKLGAHTDSVPRQGESDQLLLSADRNPNGTGARLTGIAADPLGSRLSRIIAGIREGAIKTLFVFGEDVTKHGLTTEDLGRLEMLVVSDILPSPTTEAAHYLLPGCAHAEKRGSFTNTKGRVQRFWQALQPPGDARPEWEFLHELVFNVTGQNGWLSIEGLFNQMARELSAFKDLTWAGLADLGVTVKV